jgi:hypothetical protein
MCEFVEDCSLSTVSLDPNSCSFSIPDSSTLLSHLSAPFFPSAVWYYYPLDNTCTSSFLFADEFITCFELIDGRCEVTAPEQVEPSETFFSIVTTASINATVYKYLAHPTQFALTIVSTQRRAFTFALEANDPCFLLPSTIQFPQANFTYVDGLYITNTTFPLGPQHFADASCGPTCLAPFDVLFVDHVSVVIVIGITCTVLPFIISFLLSLFLARRG